MDRCAVVIGVNKTGDLPVLRAAASGAREFAAWATAQGMDVTLLTDDNGRVSLGDVNASIRNYVQRRTFGQLIVFFSGHGILRAPDYELWLLSGAPDDPNDAVNVPGSVWLARNVGIPHVIIISDACRSRPNTSRLSQVQGGVIFPNESPKTPRPAVDVFYAALPGDPALEVSTKDATENYRGVFTDCLLKGLRGDVPDIIVNIRDQQLSEPKWVVPSWQLKPYLEREVPNEAARIHIKLQQDPDIRVESHAPNYLADVAPPKSSTTTIVDSASRNAKFDVGRRLRVLNTAEAVSRLIKAKGRESFETRTGFSVLGTAVERAIVTNSACDLFEENGAYQIRVHNDGSEGPARSALIQIERGIGVPLAVLPGFIGTIVVENGHVVTVTYLPSRHTLKHDEYLDVAAEVNERRAFVAVAARNGSFRLESSAAAVDGAKFLRTQKSIDPTLGLYAAYAYAQAGDLEGIESVFDYMSSEPEPILFDVAMLANKFDKKHGHGGRLPQIAPFCPMLTQGWALIEPNEMWLQTIIRRVREDLRPGLWTSIEKSGVAKLWSQIENGGLI